MERYVCETIEKWYKQLNFPKKYDEEFYKALSETDIPKDVSPESFNTAGTDGKLNLLSVLYMCEELKKRYAAKGISEEILYDTLYDIVIWTNVWSDLKSELWLGELCWLSNHLGMRLFKLGRLQFCMGKSENDIPTKNISKGDKVIEIHIPATGSLSPEKCESSINTAKDFFAEYYPNYEYKYFTCHSWLMDPSLKQFQKSDSNIIKFQNMFEIFNEEKSDAILKYVFKWDTERNNLNEAVCRSDFAKKVKRHVLSGGDFHAALGIMER